MKLQTSGGLLADPGPRQVIRAAVALMGLAGVIATAFAVTSWAEQGPAGSNPIRVTTIRQHVASPAEERWTVETAHLRSRRLESELTVYIVGRNEDAEALRTDLARASNIRAAAGEPPLDYAVVVIAPGAEHSALVHGNQLALQVRYEAGLPPVYVVDLR